MRFLYAIIAVAIWVFFLDYCVNNGGLNISDDLTVMTMSIIAAGTLAGGE